MLRCKNADLTNGEKKTVEKAKLGCWVEEIHRIHKMVPDASEWNLPITSTSSHFNGSTYKEYQLSQLHQLLVGGINVCQMRN